MPGIRRFFEEENITVLPILLDPKQAVAREMAVLGLPITVILDPEGREIARLRGDADWYLRQRAVDRRGADGAE